MITENYINTLKKELQNRKTPSLISMHNNAETALKAFSTTSSWSIKTEFLKYLNQHHLTKSTKIDTSGTGLIKDARKVYRAIQKEAIALLKINGEYQNNIKALGLTAKINKIAKKKKVQGMFSDILQQFKTKQPIATSVFKNAPDLKINDLSWMHLAAKYDRDDIIKDLNNLPVDFFSKKFGLNKNKTNPLELALNSYNWNVAKEISKGLKSKNEQTIVLDSLFELINDETLKEDNNGLLNYVQALHNAGFDLASYHNKHTGRTLLQQACLYLNKDLVQLMLKAGCPVNGVNYQDDEKTAVYYALRGSLKQNEGKSKAVSQKSLDALKDILNDLSLNGSSLNYQDAKGITPAKFLFFHGFSTNTKDRSHIFPVLKVGMDCGLDPLTLDYKGNTLLHDLVLRGKSVNEMSKKDNIWNFFIQNKVNLDVENLAGQTPLALAYQKDDFNTFSGLIEAGADIGKIKFISGNLFTNILNNLSNNKLKNKKKSYSYYSSQKKYKGIAESVGKLASLLVSKNVDVDAKDHMGRTPLFLCIINNNSEMFDFIVQRTNASLLDKDNFGLTAMEILKQRNLNVSDIMRKKLEILKEKQELRNFIINDNDPASNSMDKTRKVRLL